MPTRHRAIGPGAGFLAGWGMLLDYVLMPALVYVLCAIAVQAIFPGVPRGLTIVVILGFNTTINLLGIEVTARLNAFWLAVSLTFIVLFVVLALSALAHGVAGARLSCAPLLHTGASPRAIFAALSVATLAFLGFDGISTLVEEARGGESRGHSRMFTRGGEFQTGLSSWSEQLTSRSVSCWRINSSCWPRW
jgi:amino acid transporter